MEAIPSRFVNPTLFGVRRGGNGDWLNVDNGHVASQFLPGDQFVFSK
jgi:hypothetical protein